jgi:nicotinate-nucleotide adenylyltransferase
MNTGKMKKTGILSGSFNPPHIGHLAIANYMLEYEGLDELWFIVSPHNPLKDAGSLVPEDQRLEMVQIAIRDEPRFHASDIEFTLPRPSYTINTLDTLSQRYPDREFYLIMGSDNLLLLDRWKEHERLVSTYKILVYPRPGYPTGDISNPNIRIVEAPLLDISSTVIRESFRHGRQLRYWLPDGLFDHIVAKNIYSRTE